MSATGTDVTARRPRRADVPGGTPDTCVCQSCGATFAAASPSFCPNCGHRLEGAWRPHLAVASDVAAPEGPRSPVWDVRECGMTLVAQHGGYLTLHDLWMAPEALAGFLWERRLGDSQRESPWDDTHDPLGPWRRYGRHYTYRDLYLRDASGLLWVQGVATGGVSLLWEGEADPAFAAFLDEVRLRASRARSVSHRSGRAD